MKGCGSPLIQNGFSSSRKEACVNRNYTLHLHRVRVAVHRARAHKSIHECKSPVNRIEASDTSMDFLLLPGPSHWRPCAPAPTASVGAAVSEMNSTSLELLYVTMQRHGRRLPTIHTNYRSWKGSGTRNAKKKQICLSYLSDLISRRSVPVCLVFLAFLGRSLLDGARNFTIVLMYAYRGIVYQSQVCLATCLCEKRKECAKSKLCHGYLWLVNSETGTRSWPGYGNRIRRTTTDPGPEALLGHEVNTHPPVELDTLIEKSQPPHVLETE